MPEPAPSSPPAEKPAPKRARLSDANASRLSVVVHTLLAVGAGWLAPRFRNDLIGGIVGIALLVAVGYMLAFALGRKGVKWWLGNGAIIYLFFFLVSWAWFLNA